MTTSGLLKSPGDTLPPLPDDLPTSPDVLADIDEAPTQADFPMPGPTIPLRSLRAGAYLVNFAPAGVSRFVTYDGTLRVEQHRTGRTASGDLYSRPVLMIPHPPFMPRPVLGPAPDPADGLPVFRRANYRYYVRITQLLETVTRASAFTLGFELHRFDHAARTWSLEGPFKAKMSWTTPPLGFPTRDDYLEGDVTNAAGAVVGLLAMGWISKHFRLATIEIDRVSASEAPLNNGLGADWHSIFATVGWDVTVLASQTNVTEPSGVSWSDAELHAGMLAWREAVDLDKEWRYHLLCVRRLDSTSRGLMYDAYGGDTNNVPREGAAISSHWQFTADPVFPEPGPWGRCEGLRFGESVLAYFRTAVHEIGHAIMLFHPPATTGNHLMQVTPQIAANAVPPVEFPDNIQWSFSVEDARRLRHLPDVVVRPGTVLRFGTDVGSSYTSVPISPTDVAPTLGLALRVSPVADAIPIGAPARVNFKLVNLSDDPLPVPKTLNMKSGHVTGTVIDPSGTARVFAPIVRYLDGPGLTTLAPKGELSNSLTLLRGPDGALFPSPGYYRVSVSVTWDAFGIPMQVSGESGFMVTAAVDEDHARTALMLLDTPDLLLSVAIGGDHIEAGQDAIRTALANPVLRPHFAFIEAKRLAKPFRKRAADVEAASKLITRDTIMSDAERSKAATLGVVEKAHTAGSRAKR